MNNQNKQKNEKEMLANKVLYITVAAMLVVMAIVVVLSSMLSRAKPNAPAESTDDISDITENTHAADTDQSKPADSLPVIAPPDTEEVIKPEPEMPTVPTFASPLASGIISKDYSDKVLVYSTTMEDYRTHMGIDINTKLGEPVLAAADGKVVDIWYDPMTGQCMKLEHDGGLASIYRNLSDTVAEGIKVGGRVKCGEVIGYVGESSMVEIAQEPHLHFEATLSGKYVNPEEYLSSKAKAELLQDNSYES